MFRALVFSFVFMLTLFASTSCANRMYIDEATPDINIDILIGAGNDNSGAVISESELKGEWKDVYSGQYIYFDGYYLYGLIGLEDVKYSIEADNIIDLYALDGTKKTYWRFEYFPAYETLVLWDLRLGTGVANSYYKKS